MDKIYKITIGNGYYLFKLEKLLKDKKISKNKLMRDTNTDYKVIQRILKGDVTRIDVTILSRLCDYFNCKETDIFEYFPNISTKE